MSTKSRASEKVQKCLRLAKSNNPAEAAAALRQAQKLMLKHNITQSDLSLASVSEVDSGGVTKAKTPAVWVVHLRSTVASVFGVHGVNSVVRKGGVYHNTISFIGVGEKPHAAQYCYDVLFRQITADRKDYISTLNSRLNAASKRNQADVFCLAWVEAVRAKVEAIAMTNDDNEVIARYKETTYGELPMGKMREPGRLRGDQGGKAFAAGHQSGSAAQLFHGMTARAPDHQLE